MTSEIDHHELDDCCLTTSSWTTATSDQLQLNNWGYYVNQLEVVSDSSHTVPGGQWLKTIISRQSMTQVIQLEAVNDSSQSAQGSQWLKSFSWRWSMTQVLQLKAVTGPFHCALLGMGQHTPELVNGTGLERTTITTLVVAMLKSMQSRLCSTVSMRLKLQWMSMILIHWKPKVIPCSMWNGRSTTLPLFS